MRYHLFRWSVTSMYDNPYMAPEANPKCLIGFRDQETKRVRTSALASINGREVTTQSGSIYILEDMDPEYRQWLDDNGLECDPDNPIRVRKLK